MGPHVVYFEVLTPHVIRLLEQGPPEAAAGLVKVFTFLEALMADQNEEAAAVAALAVGDEIAANPHVVRTALKFAGPRMAYYVLRTTDLDAI